ncbi:MAG: PepSY-associated TM helix domain-containing protein [Pseudomonadota bacterium]
MIALDQTRTKRLVAVHGWSGTVLGILLYAVVLTGSVAVFANEIGHWSRGGGESATQISGRVHQPLMDLSRTVDPSFLEEVTIRPEDGGRLRIAFQRHQPNPATGRVEDYAEVFHIDAATGAVRSRETGYVQELRGDDRMAALEQFLIDLHVRLYVPEPWGLFLTGVLGLAMMAAAVSGFMMHRHLLRDLFAAPRARGLLADRRDRHVLAAAWGLPFSVLLAFTGAFLSFAISLGVPLVAMVAFGGDQRALVETVVGAPQVTTKAQALPASLDYVVLESTERAGAPPSFILIENFGTDAALVSSFHGYTKGGITRKTLMFDGATRAYLGEKPTLGTEPSAGSAAVSLMGPLHFGDFAGLASKTAWFALGLAMSFVIASGLQLWVHRRSEEPVWRRFGRVVEIAVWGLPLALLGTTVAFFLAAPAGDTLWWTPAGFLISAGLVVWLGLRAGDVACAFRPIAAGLCIGLPVLRHLTGGTSWSEALIAGQTGVLTIDILLIAVGLVLLQALPLQHFAAARRVPRAAE